MRPVFYFTKALLTRTNSFPVSMIGETLRSAYSNMTTAIVTKTVIKLRQRVSKQERIDTKLTEQLEKEKCYWKEVLKRVVVAVIKALASRGLAFRGSDERFGETNNGNYLMMLEVIAQFDPFLVAYISRCGNKGSEPTSYLSSTICNELVSFMERKSRE